MKSPNSTYRQPDLQGGTPVDTGVVVKIFCDYKVIASVRSGGIRLSSRTLMSTGAREFLIEDNELSIKLSRQQVRVRGVFREDRHIFLYDKVTDEYLGTAKLRLEPYGDIDSIGEDDKKAIMGHSKKVKAQHKILEGKMKELNEEIARMDSIHVDLEEI